jgi:tRNA A37 threonylcarbamoyladenosine dehydratase
MQVAQQGRPPGCHWQYIMHEFHHKWLRCMLCCDVLQEFLDPVRAAALVQEQQYQFVIDCIDSIAPKQALLLAGHTAGKCQLSTGHM